MSAIVRLIFITLSCARALRPSSLNACLSIWLHCSDKGQWQSVYDSGDLADMADQWLTTGTPHTVQEIVNSVSQAYYEDIYRYDIESCGLGLVAFDQRCKRRTVGKTCS